MRQQLADAAGRLRGQPLENVLQVRMRFVPIEFGGLDQAQDRGSAFAGLLRTHEKPIPATDGNHRVILPMSGKKLRSSTAGTRCMGDA